MIRPSLLVALLLTWTTHPVAHAADHDDRAEGVVATADAAISGRIIERGTGAPVEALVRIGARQVQSNANGGFDTILPAGTWTAEIISLVHLPVEITFEAAAGASVNLSIELEPDEGLEELNVYGDEDQETVSRSVYDAEELRSIPGSFGDPIRALQSLPGVSRASGLQGDLVVRGAEGINTATFMEGVPVPFLFHWFVGRSIVHPTMLADIEFYPGGMPSKFGSALQSVVNARLTHPTHSGVKGRIAFDLLDGSVSLDGKKGDVEWGFGGRYAWVGPVIGAVSKLDAKSKGLNASDAAWIAPSYWDYTARVAWTPGRHRFSFLAFGARDSLRLNPPEGATDDIEGAELVLPLLPFDPFELLNRRFQRFQLRHTWTNGRNEHDTWLAVGFQEETNLLRGLGLLGNGPDFGRVAGWTIHGRHDSRWDLNDRFAMRVGAETELTPLEVQDFSGIVSANVDIPTTRDVAIRAGAWAEAPMTLGRLWLSPGFRLAAHRFNDLERVIPEPRLSARYDLNDRWEANAFVGRFSQRPPAERYAEALGNPELDVMKAWQASAGAKGDLGGGLQLTTTAFATAYDDLVITDARMEVVEEIDNLTGETSARSVLTPDYRATGGYAYGAEAMLRWRPSKQFFGWVALTASRTLRVEDDGTVFPGDFDQPISLTLVGAYTTRRRWQVSGRFRTSSGHPFTPFHEFYDPWNSEWQGMPGVTNSERLPYFMQFDVRVEKQFVGKHTSWTIFADVHNATNRRNMLAATYKPNFAELAPTLWFPIIPNLGVEIDF